MTPTQALLIILCLFSSGVTLAETEAPLNSVNSGSVSKTRLALICSTDFGPSAQLTDVEASTEATWAYVPDGHVGHFLKTQVIWCQFRLKTAGKAEWLVGVGDPNVELVSFYNPGDNRPWATSGVRFHHHQRKVRSRSFYFPLGESNPQETTLFLRLESFTLNAPVILITESRFNKMNSDHQSLSSLAFGFIVPLAAGIILTRKLSGAHRHKLRFWGAAIVLAYVLSSTAVQGYGYQYFWPSEISWNRIAIIVFAGAGLFTVFQYTSALSSMENKWLKQLALGLSAATILAALTYFFVHSNVILACAYLLLLATVLLVLFHMVYIALKVRIGTEGPFWALWMGSVGVTLAQAFGIINLNLNIELMTALNFLMLTFLLGWDLFLLVRNNQQLLIRTFEEKIAHEHQIAELEQERNESLEAKVTERTKELDRMMRELHMSNVRLRTASSIDTLTGVMNRYAVEQYIEEKWHDCLEQTSDFCIGFVDADHFKSVNDTYGHDTGDICLKQLATMLTNSLTNTDMRAARYGGEEFIVVAPGTTAKQLSNVLESFRAILETTPIQDGDTQFTVTVSVGIASVRVTNTNSAREIIKQADKALYQAKAQGRNQVVLYSDMTDNELKSN